MSDQRKAIIFVAVQSVKGGAMNIHQASQAYGINYPTLRRHCRKAGVIPGGLAFAKISKETSVELENWLDAIISKKVSINYVAKRCGVARATVQRHLKRKAP